MRYRLATALAVVVTAFAATGGEDACPPAGDVPSLLHCALTSSEAAVRIRAELEAARARRSVAARLLPSNPTLEVGAGRRKSPAGNDIDRSVELSQSFEIAGQRGARLGAAEAELRSAQAAADAVEREITADLLTAVGEVVRSRRAQELSRDQREAADKLVEVTRARASQGVAAPLDSELAEAARVQALRDERTASREEAEANARLAFVIGADARLLPTASLPQPGRPQATLAALEDSAVAALPEIARARAEVEASRARADLLRRERIPDVTIAAGLRHEEFSDVLGARISVPLPLFRRNQGEIAEEEIRTREAAASARQAELRVRLAVRAAFASWQRAQAAAGAIAPDLERRLRADIVALQDAYQRGTMPLTSVLASLREVQGARRTVLDAHADAATAWLTLARAAALPPCAAGGCR